MKVFRVFNGQMGFDAIYRIVLAETPERAIALAALVPEFARRSDGSWRKLEACEAKIDAWGVETEDSER